nr:MAG TPA: DNA-directed RNA polymerase subunit alpha [Caudoviricetes sp.]
MKKKTPYVYTICRIDTKDWRNINHELVEHGYKDIKCFVPTLTMVKKTYRGQKKEVEEVPMLFNYGFIRMRSEVAYNRNFLFHLKREIPGIVSFLKSLDSMHVKKKRRRVDNAEDWDDFSKVATVTKKEFRHYMRLSRANQVFSLDEVMVNVGDFVVMRGYPLDGMPAKVLDFNYPNKTAIVEIYPGEGSVLSMQIPLENILYSPYEHYREDLLASKIEFQDLSNTPEQQ